MIKNKGFTLIEFIIVMAIIGILVLMATPKFMDYVRKAKETQIKNDVRVVQDVLLEEITKAVIEDREAIFWDKTGKINDEIINKVNTKLKNDKKGDFYYFEDEEEVEYILEISND